MRRKPWKCFRHGSEDHLIAKCPKPTKDNDKRRKRVRFNKKGNRACDNGKNNSDQNVYAYMARMPGNEEFPSGNFGDSSKLTNWILDSVSTCHITPEVSDFIPYLLKDTDKHIEVAYGHQVTEKKNTSTNKNVQE